ncbi:hypothetical protein, partial [Burkholderia lata]|uniref:hypothetical protein n=1 Tax=Burkholderia lata (strain ATCC 17760 / DSM 23089 / LMG 22485 / NCIMB 9086 / R18194 / 383) TaxID=482957 RepID=UPI003F5CA99B
LLRFFASSLLRFFASSLLRFFASSLPRFLASPIRLVEASGASMPSWAFTLFLSRIEAQDLERAGAWASVDWAHQHLPWAPPCGQCGRRIPHG